MHWHGVLLPNGMDGVAGLVQPHIEPGETYVYEFTLRQHGTLMYHPHSDEMVQMALGMMGFFVVHPRGGAPRRSRLRHHAPRVGDRAGDVAPEPGRDDRLQHVHVQQPGVAGHRAARREEGRPRARAPRQPEHGQPPDPPARAPLRGHRHGRGHGAAERAVPRGHDRRPRRRDARHRVRGRQPGRLGVSLPQVPSHDERDEPRPAEHASASSRRTPTTASAASSPGRWRWAARGWAT